MTDRHTSWSPEDDERIRAALMSLREDVTALPLPEPSAIRARAEGRTEGRSVSAEATGQGSVVTLASRRRRSFAVIVGVAAAAVIATGASLLVWDRDDSTPSAASSSRSSTDLRPLTMLGASQWSVVLGLDVTSTSDAAEPTGQCFRTPDSTTETWTRTTATLSDGRAVGGQWIGTASSGSMAPTGAIDAAVERCRASFATTQEVTEDRPGGARFRAWRAEGPDGAGVWWVEATRGPSTSFISVAEVDGVRYSSDDMRELARGALGQVDLTGGGRAATTSPGTETPAPSTTSSTSTPTPTTSTGPATSPLSPASPASTSGGSTGTATPAPTSTPTPPAPSVPSDSPRPPTFSPTTIGPITGAYLVPPASWSTATLNGSRQVATSATPAGAPIDACTSAVTSEHTRGWSLATVGGDGRAFGQQHIYLEADAATADSRLREITAAYERSTCTGAEGDPTTVTKIGPDVYRLDRAGSVRYVSLARLRSPAVSVLVLDGSALKDRSEDDLASELRRLNSLAALR